MDGTETTEAAINRMIKENICDTNLISDGYHTFAELYEHRIVLYIKLAEMASCMGDANSEIVWRSKTHSDGSVWDGWFILGINTSAGKQITYHLPSSKWDETDFANTLDKAPDWDGHNPADVLERLKEL